MPARPMYFGAWASWSRRLPWEQEIAGSNPAAPTGAVVYRLHSGMWPRQSGFNPRRRP